MDKRTIEAVHGRVGQLVSEHFVRTGLVPTDSQVQLVSQILMTHEEESESRVVLPDEGFIVCAQGHVWRGTWQFSGTARVCAVGTCPTCGGDWEGVAPRTIDGHMGGDWEPRERTELIPTK